MIKSKYLLFFSSFLLLVSVLLGMIFAKYSPFLFRTPVFYCEHFSCSALIKIASTIGTTIFKVLLITLLLTFGKTVLDLYRHSILRRSLILLKNKSLKLNNITKETGLQNRTIVVKHNEPFAFCLGLISSKIVVSNSLIKMLNDDELKAVLYHEKYHLEHADALTIYIGRLAQSLFPFFPFLKDQIKYLALNREIKADRLATKETGDNQAVISSLKKLLSHDFNPAFSTFPAFIDNHDFLEIRIKELLQKKVNFLPFSFKNVVISLGALIVMAGLIYLPFNTVNIDAADNKEVVACINDEACRQECLSENHNNDSLFNQLHPH